MNHNHKFIVHNAEETAEYISKMSTAICIDNNCNDENHNCESNAYFDLACSIEYKTEFYIVLQTICQSDYCQRHYDLCLPLPWHGNDKQLRQDLEQLWLNES